MPDQPRAYLVIGTDRTAADEFVRSVSKNYSDESIERWNAATTTATDVVDACSMMALLATERLIIAAGIEAWKKEDVDAVVAYMKAPSEDSTLILIGSKLDARSRLRKAIGTENVIEVAGPKNEREALKWATEQFALLGADVKQPVVKLLVERTGFEALERLRTDIQMIAVSAGDGPVTSELVLELATESAEAKVYALTDAWATRNKGQLIRMANQLLEQREHPVRLTLLLGRHIGQVSRARRLLDVMPAPAVLSQLKSDGVNEWAGKKIVDQAGKIGLGQAEAALARIALLDHELKGGSNMSGKDSVATLFTRGLAEL